MEGGQQRPDETNFKGLYDIAFTGEAVAVSAFLAYDPVTFDSKGESDTLPAANLMSISLAFIFESFSSHIFSHRLKLSRKTWARARRSRKEAACSSEPISRENIGLFCQHTPSWSLSWQAEEAHFQNILHSFCAWMSPVSPPPHRW